jgi:hypothetical protein
MDYADGALAGGDAGVVGEEQREAGEADRRLRPDCGGGQESECEKSGHSGLR